MQRDRRLTENKAASLKSYLLSILNGEKYNQAKVSISYRTGTSVDIAEGAVVPDKFLKYSEPTPDKTGLKAALKAGEILPGITLVASQNIQIK